MKKIYELWRDAVEELIQAERFWSAAIVAMGGIFAAVLSVVALLVLTIKVFGIVGYTLLVISIGLWGMQRSMRKHYEKSLEDDEDDEDWVE